MQQMKKMEKKRKDEQIPRSVNFENIIEIPLWRAVYDDSQMKFDVNMTLLYA